MRGEPFISDVASEEALTLRKIGKGGGIDA